MKILNPVSRSDVVLAYCELLGREPESEEAIRGYFGFNDVAQMREVICASAEYRMKAGVSPVMRKVALATCLPPVPEKVRRVGFVGNCQVNGLAALVNAMQNQVEAVALELTESSSQALQKQASHDLPWQRLDVIWAHPHAQFSTWLQHQPEAFEARVRPLPTIDTLGFQPDCAYVWQGGRLIDSPIGAYHSALVLLAYRQGLSAEQTVALFRPEVFAHLGYLDYPARA